MSRTTVTMSAASKKIWEKLKEKFSAKSADALVSIIGEKLLDEIDPNQDAESNLGEAEANQGAPKRRKKNVQDPLFTFEILQQRHEMLCFYTALDGPTIVARHRRTGGVADPAQSPGNGRSGAAQQR